MTKKTDGAFRKGIVMFQFQDIVQIHFGFGWIKLNETRHKLVHNFVRAHMGEEEGLCILHQFD